MFSLNYQDQVVVRQRKELAELVGFETRNKYEINDPQGKPLFFCAEQQKGFLGFLLRQFLGHWRSFELGFYDTQRSLIWKAEHPFRWIFQRLDLFDSSGKNFGSVEWKWGIFRKRFQLTNHLSGQSYMINSGFFSFWTFVVVKDGQEAGRVTKKWSGILKEVFTDSDNFLVQFGASLQKEDRALLLSTSILIDLQYFEGKGSGGVVSLIGD